MNILGKYCKIYSTKKLGEFGTWIEKSKNSNDKIWLYLQENYVVTGSIFKDRDIIFDDVTPEWLEFCKHSLKFEIPLN